MIFDLVVLGAGVVGLSTARYFSEKYSDWNILLVEKNTRHGLGISSRNSEVIHAGIYYPPEWLKSKLCIEGRRNLYPFLEKYNIPHKKTGKFIVAVDEYQINPLAALCNVAQDKGVDGLQLLDGGRISKLEPKVNCLAGIFSSESGILSVDRYMDVQLNLFKANGGGFLPGTRFADMSLKGELMELCFHSNQDGEQKAMAKRTINATGLSVNQTSTDAHFNDIPNIFFCKGHYFQVTGARHAFTHMVYPLPDETFLGIHITPDLSGEIKIGPDAVYLNENLEDYGEFLSSAESFIKDVRRYWPGITSYTIQPVMTGIRPKLYDRGEIARDFLIRDEAQADCPNWINLFGIESPGVTASLAFGPYIDEIFFCENKG
ncbi:MAG: NAD(P)/FAD-dependent oxidoreductase [Candidatus Marinimicrobia bacterium]|nr:NAD(P)/FAD-dependent oxidoreductase [Candidatus Neomarinimicrobiota bacterium]